MFAPRSVHINQAPLIKCCVLPLFLLLLNQGHQPSFAWGCLIVLVAYICAQAVLVYGSKWLPRQPFGILLLSEACKWCVFSLSIYMVISYKLQSLAFILGIMVGLALVFRNLFYYGKRCY